MPDQNTLPMKPTAGMQTTQPRDGKLEPRVLQRDEHNISRRNISKGALNVIYDLTKAGFEAYLVGGGIRDLMLGMSPKDFDVATNATPEQIKALFRRSRIVGRRFRIVHVRFGREVIEVTTFRAGQNDPEQSNSPLDTSQVTSESGMLLRDNVFGSVEEDALRRDFTINALYYSIDGFRVIDYAGGLADLENRLIRIIGDPETRYLEDPVRMLRALRFAAKLNFNVESDTLAPLSRLAPALREVSSARLFDEVNKLLLNESAVECLKLVIDHGLFHELFPKVGPRLTAHPGYLDILLAALENTASRVQAQKPVTPAFLFAALLWPRVHQLCEENIADGCTPQRAMQMAGFQAIDEQVLTITIPKRFSIAMREIWSLQRSLLTANNKRALTLLSHPRFRAAYDFLLVREAAGEKLQRGADFWTELQIQHPEALNSDQRKSRRYNNRGGRHRGKPARSGNNRSS